jgi:hypothetical protein
MSKTRETPTTILSVIEWRARSLVASKVSAKLIPDANRLEADASEPTL